MTHSPAADLELLERAARAAGERTLDWFGALKDADVAAKAGGEPVTQADLAAERALSEMLRNERPDYGWLSEETDDDQSRLTRDAAFVIDPIDGTRAFIQGAPQYVISAAVVRDGKPVAGALYQPARDVMYAASLGGGARRNGEPIAVDDASSLAGARLVCPKGHLAEAKWRRPWPQDLKAESRNSMAYRIAMVARGDWHGALSLSEKSDWDLAAADLILQEAGGVITDLAGRAFRYNEAETRKSGVVCGGPEFHAALMEQLRERR